MGLAELLNRAARKIGVGTAPKASSSVVTHDSLDTMAFRNYVDESARFQRAVRDDAPKIIAKKEPEPIDMATATTEEIQDARDAAVDYNLAKLDAKPYSAWEELAHDIFSAYHAHDEPGLIEDVDAGVELHKKIVSRLIHDDDFRDSRPVTRNDDMTSAVATMAALRELKGALCDELADQARQAEEYRNAEQDAQAAWGELDELRGQAGAMKAAGQPIPEQLKQDIGAAVAAKQAAQARAAASTPAPLNSEAASAVTAAAQAGAEAADKLNDLPSVGAGLGGSEFSYESPDEALEIAEQWSNNPQLKLAAEMFGRLDRDMRFHRSKRVIGGQDEIVDIELSDNLARVIPAELALLADDDTELDFLARYAAGELLTFSTVGEEHGGRGPIVCVIDGSGSMTTKRTAWARAVAMCLLHICRRERRDFAAVEFGSASQHAVWEFPKSETVPAKRMMEMASHFFGGGTAPLSGMEEAEEVISRAAAFSEADVVLIGDGEATFTDADMALRDRLVDKGVRIFGIGVGGSFAYLTHYCEHVVSIADFELDNPSTATASLAVHLS